MSDKKFEKRGPVRTQNPVRNSSGYSKGKPAFKSGLGTKIGINSSLLPKEIVIEKKVFSGVVPLIPMILSDFAILVGIACNDIIVNKLKEGKMFSKNRLLSVQELKDLCLAYELQVEIPALKIKDELFDKSKLSQENMKKRSPVVVVMGHVDHGKTTLLDFIRKTRVAAKEKGGITQHLGAYEVSLPQGTLVFLDTPGHEAFSKIRKRGACVADIAILVIAADDGIMPQTVESIKAIKALNVTVIVAINKMDKVDEGRIETIKRQLAQYDLLPEEWGGIVTCVPVSAKTGFGIDQLLEMICLHAELMELSAAIELPAFGYILETKLQKGRGIVATVLCRQGTLKVGDFFNAGGSIGKVTSLINSAGKELKSVGPSIPVLIAGFSDMPEVGASLEVISEEESKKIKTIQSLHESDKKNLLLISKMQSQIEKGEPVYKVILKADTHSSLEAIIDGFHKISSKAENKKIVIIRSGMGDITESDILTASNSDCVIIGFNIKIEHNAIGLERKMNIPIHLYSIIYKLFEVVEKTVLKIVEIKKVSTKIGEALILKVFDIKKLGIVAGAVVRDGRFSEKGKVVILRGRKTIGDGKIKSLQRDKKTVKEVHTGFECAFVVDGFEDWKVDDIAECYLDI